MAKRCRATRKACYLKGVAWNIARLRNATKGYGGYAYECEHCGYWHVTKKPKGKINWSKL